MTFRITQSVPPMITAILCRNDVTRRHVGDEASGDNHCATPVKSAPSPSVSTESALVPSLHAGAAKAVLLERGRQRDRASQVSSGPAFTSIYNDLDIYDDLDK